MNHIIPYSEFYSTKSFIHDYLDGRNLKYYLPFHFTDSLAYQNIADQLSQRIFPRELVSEVLTEQNKLFQAGEKTFRQIKEFKDSKALVVVGGQQTGLFGGPLYTLYKAITIIKLADFLSTTIKQKVIPIFWMASDDHDYAEVNHINLPNLSGQQIEILAYGQDDNEKIPVSGRRFSVEIEDKIQLLYSYLPETEFSSAILERLESAYRQNNSFPLSFGIWMQFILRDFGLIVIDSSDLRFKQSAIPLFRKEIDEESPVSKAVIDQTNDIIKSGYNPQIRLNNGLLNLFFHDPQREIIAISNGELRLKNTDRKFTKSELIQILDKHPEKFSPNAVLRPLYQDTLFPTIAIVLGPSELAYFAQLRKAYESMNVIMPIAFPRTTITLLEPRTERILKKYKLSIQDVFQQKDKMINMLTEQEIPKSMFSIIDEEEQRVAQIWTKLVDHFSEFDQNLKKPSEIAKGRSISQFSFLRKKLLQAARQKDEVLRSQILKLMNLTYPKNTPQERVFNLLPFYVRYGDQFINVLFERMDIFNPNHQVINLSQE